MKIAYIGRVTLLSFAGFGKWDKAFPDVKWGFPLGSEIVKRLVKKGHEVFVVTEHTVDTVQKFSCSTTCGRLEVWLVPSWKRSRWTFLSLFYKEMKGIRSAICEIRPDVVFAQWTYHNAYAGLTSGYPTLVVAHDSPWRVARMFRNMQTLIRAIYATLFVIPKIRHLTAVSPHMVEEFKKFRKFRRFGKSGGLEIPVIPNGIEIRDERGGMRQTFPSPIPHPPTIVSISQAGRLKNSQALFRAWDILKLKHPDWRLKVFGQGMPDGQVSREELDWVLREEADLFVSPSLEESFGMVFVEAMRFGVPCIGGEKSGAVPWVLGSLGGLGGSEGSEGLEGLGSLGGLGGSERLKGSESTIQTSQGLIGGVVCDVTRPDKLAECIERVMDDTELRMHLSEGGKRRVKEMFDIEKVVEMYERELERVRGEGCGMRDEIEGMGNEEGDDDGRGCDL